MLKPLMRLHLDEKGATAIEYTLIASFISIVIVGVLMMINQEMASIFNYIGENLEPALSNSGGDGRS